MQCRDFGVLFCCFFFFAVLSLFSQLFPAASPVPLPFYKCKHQIGDLQPRLDVSPCMRREEISPHPTSLRHSALTSLSSSCSRSSYRLTYLHWPSIHLWMQFLRMPSLPSDAQVLAHLALHWHRWPMLCQSLLPAPSEALQTSFASSQHVSTSTAIRKSVWFDRSNCYKTMWTNMVWFSRCSFSVWVVPLLCPAPMSGFLA